MKFFSGPGERNPDTDKKLSVTVSDDPCNEAGGACNPSELNSTFGTGQDHIIDSALIGNIGRLRYISELEKNNAEELKKPVDGLMLIGNMGETSYGEVPSSDRKSKDENTDSELPFKLYGSIGKRIYRHDIKATKMAPESGDSKLAGSIGKKRYGTVEAEHSREDNSCDIRKSSDRFGIYPRKTVVKVPEVSEPEYGSSKRSGRCILTAASLLAVLAVLSLALYFWLDRHDFSDAISARITDEVVHGDNLPLEHQYSNAILETIVYRIESKNIINNTATVNFRYVDVIALADSIGNRAVDWDTYYKLCIEAMRSGTAPLAQKTIKLNFEERGTGKSRKLCVVDSYELSDIISGGTVSAFADAVGEIYR